MGALTGRRSFIVDRSGRETPLPLRSHSYQYPRLSPDGKRLAIVQESERNGENDLWVYNDPGIGWRWRQSGVVGGRKELFYRAGERVMAVEVTRQPTLRATTPRELFRAAYVTSAAGGRQYHVGPDGCFVMLKRVLTEATAAQPKIVLDVNWFDALQEKRLHLTSTNAATLLYRARMPRAAAKRFAASA